MDNEEKNGRIPRNAETLKTESGKIRNINRPITINELKIVIKNPTSKMSRSRCFTGECYKTFFKKLTPIFHKLFQKISEE